MASTHTLGLAQDLLFGGFVLAGGVLYVLKSVGVIADAAPWLMDITGWHIATVVLGTIVGIRLLLAPYWLYREARDKLARQDSAAYREKMFRELEEIYARGRHFSNVTCRMPEEAHNLAIKEGEWVAEVIGFLESHRLFETPQLQWITSLQFSPQAKTGIC